MKKEKCDFYQIEVKKKRKEIPKEWEKAKGKERKFPTKEWEKVKKEGKKVLDQRN